MKLVLTALEALIAGALGGDTSVGSSVANVSAASDCSRFLLNMSRGIKAGRDAS